MKDFISVSWIVVIIVGLIGAILTTASFKFFKAAKGDEKDSFGVAWSERFGFAALNGIVLFLGALTVAILKFLYSF